MTATTFPIFVTGVTFPKKLPGGIRRAWLELEDDADCHPLKIAVPIEFARAIAEHVPSPEEEECIAQITIAFDMPEAEDVVPSKPRKETARDRSKSREEAECELALQVDAMLRARGFWPSSWRRANGEGVDLTVDSAGKFAFDWIDADPSDRCDVGVTLDAIDKKTKRDAGR